MSLLGGWRIVETPGYDMAGPAAYIQFDADGGEFALDYLTGSFHGACEDDTVDFDWQGNDEMGPASGNGWAELCQDGSLEGEIHLNSGDDIPFIARRDASSTAG